MVLLVFSQRVRRFDIGRTNSKYWDSFWTNKGRIVNQRDLALILANGPYQGYTARSGPWERRNGFKGSKPQTVEDRDEDTNCLGFEKPTKLRTIQARPPPKKMLSQFLEANRGCCRCAAAIYAAALMFSGLLFGLFAGNTAALYVAGSSPLDQGYLEL